MKTKTGRLVIVQVKLTRALEYMQTDMHYFDSNALKWPINSNNCSSPSDNLCCLLLYIKTLKRCQSPINTSHCIKFPFDLYSEF